MVREGEIKRKRELKTKASLLGRERGTEPGDLCSRILTLNPMSEHRPGPGCYFWEGEKAFLNHIQVASFLPKSWLSIWGPHPSPPISQLQTPHTIFFFFYYTESSPPTVSHRQPESRSPLLGQYSEVWEPWDTSITDNQDFKMSVSYLPALFNNCFLLYVIYIT